VVGGYFVVDVPDRAAAIELAKRCRTRERA